MSRVELLRQARVSYAVKFREFIVLFSRCKTSNAIICFFEEEDSKYYGIRIRIKMPEYEIKTIQCGGKQNVIKLCELIKGHEEYKKARVGFFIDRDFDDPIKGYLSKYIYETPCYSIENLYTTSDSVSRILREEFNICEVSDDDTILEECINLYNNIQSKYHEAIEELNIWIMYQIEYYKSNPVNRINLNNVRFDRLVTINIDSVIKKYEISKIKEMFPESIDITGEKIAERLSYIDKSQRGRIFRGKYEIEFLRKFLTLLKKDRNNSKPIFFKKKTRVKISLSRENIIGELSQYADTPECLLQYFEKIRPIKKAA